MCIANKKRFKDHPVTDKTKKRMRDSRLEYFDKPGSREANSKSQKKRFKDHPQQKGGEDIVGHHMIYDHLDLTKNIISMTRSMHTRLHNLFRKYGIEIPHINIKEEL